LLDGIVMEELGVPAVVIITEPFVSPAQAMAVAHGLPHYPFVVIPHPIAATASDILRGWADQVTDQVIGMFLHTTG
jgi:hypothetical protein